MTCHPALLRLRRDPGVRGAARRSPARNPVHSALWLVLSFFSAAGVWLLLQAEFLAIALVLVYVGAVMVLFLFVVMMLDVNFDKLRERLSQLHAGRRDGRRADPGRDGAGADRRLLPAGATPARQAAPDRYSNTSALGRLIYTDYVYPVRDRGGDLAGGDHRRHRADASHAAGDEVSGSGRAGEGPSRRPAADHRRCRWKNEGIMSGATRSRSLQHWLPVAAGHLWGVSICRCCRSRRWRITWCWGRSCSPSA